MASFAVIFFISSFFSGVVIVSYFLSMLPRFAKISASFFVGTYLSTMFVFVTAVFFKNSDDSLRLSLLAVLVLQILFISLIFLKKRSLLAMKASRFEIILLLLFFCFGWYIMQKSFGYTGNNFAIASNVYLDFGSHIPIIRSFSEGDNIPPTFPFAAGIPLLYHFFFDFMTAMYEKMGIRIDYAFNFLSALSFAGVLSLIFSLSQELYGKKKIIGIIAVVLFVFNSSLSFLTAIEKYFGTQIFSKLYHHNIYFGDGPFGKSIVSIFWNLNTYVNQRHFLFALGFGLICAHIFHNSITHKKVTIPWLFLACVVGLLPFWHTSVFLAVMSMAVVTIGILLLLKKEWKSMVFFVIVAGFIAMPQLLFIKHYQSVQFAFFNSGFLVADRLTIKTFITYWFYNLGISIFLIPIGIYLAKKKERLFFIPIVILFLLPNIFQLSPQMFDNHKFFNMFILLANIYTAYALYLLLKKKFLFKIFAFALLFLLTFSGVTDFMVLKNDVKTQVRDYPNNKFLLWVKDHTDPNAVFLTNADIYDPITFIGRKSFLGRPHYLWAYGVNPGERQTVKAYILSSDDAIQSIKLLKTNKIQYVVLYKHKHPLTQQLKMVYQDDAHLVLQVI